MNQSLTFSLTDTLEAVEALGLFVSVCDIYDPSQSVNGMGQVDLSDYTPVTGLQNIPCMRAVLSDVKPNPYYEQKLTQQVNEMNIYHVLLDGYYPTILQKQIAVIDGDLLDILNVECDSQRIMTRLAVRRYSL
jgi:hypothetical protein